MVLMLAISEQLHSYRCGQAYSEALASHQRNNFTAPLPKKFQLRLMAEF